MDLLDTLNRDGFVIVRSVLPPDRIAPLRAVAAEAAALARSGRWPHVRVVGKQFPPWDPALARERGIWGVQHLMSPDLPGSAAFAAVYFSEPVLAVARELLQCGDDDLVMELLNMLVRPGGAVPPDPAPGPRPRPFSLRWHRDDISESAGPEEEARRLAEPAWHAQYNLALYDDDSLVVVPGSHARPRTAEERAITAAAADAGADADLPGQLRVRLGPGDAVFYNNNILHRAVYASDRERMTLHGSVGHAAGSERRARNVLQHGVAAWVERCDLGAVPGLDPDSRRRAEGMRARLLRMGRGRGGEAVEYSLEG